MYFKCHDGFDWSTGQAGAVLLGALALVTCSVQVGILHGRASCQLPNLARVGP